jgi:hypothetical protein
LRTADEAESGETVSNEHRGGLDAPGPTSIGVVCETEAFGTSGLGIVDEAKSLDFAGAAEDVGDLLFREACDA